MCSSFFLDALAYVGTEPALDLIVELASGSEGWFLNSTRKTELTWSIAAVPIHAVNACKLLNYSLVSPVLVLLVLSISLMRMSYCRSSLREIDPIKLPHLLLEQSCTRSWRSQIITVSWSFLMYNHFQQLIVGGFVAKLLDSLGYKVLG